jgi:hypothetical protein
MKKKIHFMIILISMMSYVSWAEEPVFFADANLKAVVEETLGITDPTPIDMLELTELSANAREMQRILQN